jgi:uncharacterized protein (TIGR02246 family)
MESNNDTDVEKINEVLKIYNDCWNPGGDFESWMDLWIEDCIQMPPDTPRNEGKEQIRAAYQPAFETLDYEMTNFLDEIRVLGDRAYAYGKYEFAFTPKGGGNTTEGKGKYLTVFEKQIDGSWKVAIDCHNFDAPLG